MGEWKMTTFGMRMEPEKKLLMEEFFEKLGLSLPYAVNVFFEMCIIESGLPFEVKLTGKKKPAKANQREKATHKSAQFVMRMDRCRKAQIEYIFRELGMTTSEAVNIYFEKCLMEWGIPFRVGYPRPSGDTLATMRDAEEASMSGNHTSAGENICDPEE